MRDRIKDSITQLSQALVILVALLAPTVFSLHSVISPSTGVALGLESVAAYIAARFGDIGIGAFLAACVLGYFRKANRDRTINKGNTYHRHGLTWYRFCSRVLGYGTCSLVRVPIYMQFRLVLGDVFDKFDCGEIDEENEADRITVETKTAPSSGDGPGLERSWVNIVVSDTYPIDGKLLPKECHQYKTICICRNAESNEITRRHSPRLVNKVADVVFKLPAGTTVNMFATTNPKNTYEIATKAFKTGGRDGLSGLYVYSQNHQKPTDGREFTDAVKIFDRSCRC